MTIFFGFSSPEAVLPVLPGSHATFDADGAGVAQLFCFCFSSLTSLRTFGLAGEEQFDLAPTCSIEFPIRVDFNGNTRFGLDFKQGAGSDGHLGSFRMRARRLGGKGVEPVRAFRGGMGVSRDGLGVGAGCAWCGAGLDVAVFAGLGEGDAEDQDAEEGLGENVTN